MEPKKKYLENDEAIENDEASSIATVTVPWPPHACVAMRTGIAVLAAFAFGMILARWAASVRVADRPLGGGTDEWGWPIDPLVGIRRLGQTLTRGNRRRAASNDFVFLRNTAAFNVAFSKVFPRTCTACWQLLKGLPRTLWRALQTGHGGLLRHHHHIAVILWDLHHRQTDRRVIEERELLVVIALVERRGALPRVARCLRRRRPKSCFTPGVLSLPPRTRRSEFSSILRGRRS